MATKAGPWSVRPSEADERVMTALRERTGLGRTSVVRLALRELAQALDLDGQDDQQQGAAA